MKLFAPQHRVDAGHELGIGYETPAGQRRVVVETAVGSGSVDILVRDSGPGLPVELTGRLFEPFVTTKTSGLGLGLSIVRSIVTAHGGRIDARKAPGEAPSSVSPFRTPRDASTLGQVGLVRRVGRVLALVN